MNNHILKSIFILPIMAFLLIGCSSPTDSNGGSSNGNNDDDGGTEAVYGCTDNEATNYNPNATIDDGSCEYPPEDVYGCTDSDATNYNPSATIDDGSCEYPPEDVYGCTDSNATNYNPSATIDDGSCEYGEPNLVVSSLDPSLNNPYGYAQLSIQITNTGDGASLDYEYIIRPCLEYLNVSVGLNLTHNFAEQYLPGLSPGEYYVIQTANEQIVNQSTNWSYTGDCTLIY